jgi:hypothetical protein
MREGAGEADLFGKYRPMARIALVGLIAVKLAFVFVFAWHIRFVMDEFQQLGFAKYLGHGFFDTFQPAKAVGFQVFAKLAHLIGGDAVGILRVGRMQVALLACGTIAMVYGCARALGERPERALAILLILLSFSNFAERIARTRAEPLAVFFAVAALFVLLRGQRFTARRIIVVGVLAGLSFLSTQKAVYFDVALGIALIGDAVLGRRYRACATRAVWLVLGWLLPVVLYCFVFGGVHPLAVAQTLFFGPLWVAAHGADVYGGLRWYVLQTLVRNAVLYALGFGGMALALARIRTLDAKRRVALIFSLVVTVLVFSHNQPWPYVFIMALPFVSLWALAPIDLVAQKPRQRAMVLAILAVAIGASFVRNIEYLRYGNEQQLDVVERAEAFTGPHETYFDGVGMLPNRQEPSTLWLDAYYAEKTLQEGERSEAFAIFTRSPPKTVIWTYRLDKIDPVVGALIRQSYVHVAPNIWIAGRRLAAKASEIFTVAADGSYGLYDERGNPAVGAVELDGKTMSPPFHLTAGRHRIALLSDRGDTLLLREGAYAGRLAAGGDYPDIFAGVYD